MNDLPPCPKCNDNLTYHDGTRLVCASCGHEWSASAPATVDPLSGDDDTPEDTTVRDAHGNVLATGDSVIVIKDLKVKGSSLVVKGGTKVKNIRLTEGAGGHNIDCKIDGIGAMQLKSEFVKKA